MLKAAPTPTGNGCRFIHTIVDVDVRSTRFRYHMEDDVQITITSLFNKVL